MTKIKGFKAFEKDLSCRGFKYEVGKEFTHEGKVKACESGFHFCESMVDVYNYYPFDVNTPVYEVEGSGVIDRGDKKIACSKILILKELTTEEKLSYLNLFTTGSSNTGSYNRGSYNRGSDNRGSYNTGSDNRGSYNRGSGNRGSGNRGSGNTGSYNRGSDNTGSYNTGIFNFSSHNVGVFNYTSFLGCNENCCCFNEPTDLSMLSFAKKFLSILKEVKIGNYSNVDKLPNYTPEKWAVISRYL